MKIGVISSHSSRFTVFNDRAYVYTSLHQAIHMGYLLSGKTVEDEKPVIVSGGGKGPEEFAIEFAMSKDYEHSVVKPHIKLLGKNAFAERNVSIAHLSDIVAVFWNGELTNVPKAMQAAALSKTPVIVFPI